MFALQPQRLTSGRLGGGAEVLGFARVHARVEEEEKNEIIQKLSLYFLFSRNKKISKQVFKTLQIYPINTTDDSAFVNMQLGGRAGCSCWESNLGGEQKKKKRLL